MVKGKENIIACAKAFDDGLIQGRKEIFDIFDKYACIKNDKWYLELKRKQTERK